MEDLIEFLTSKEIIVVYIVTGLACFLCFVVYLIDKNHYKRKRRQNTRELNKLVEEVNEQLDNEKEIDVEVEDLKEDTLYIPPVIEPSHTETLEQYQTISNKKSPTEERLIVQEEMDLESIPPSVQEVYAPKEEIQVENLILENMENMSKENTSFEKGEEHIPSPSIAIAENSPPLKDAESFYPQYEEHIDPIKTEEKTSAEKPKEKLVYTNIEPNPQQAQKELLKLTEELEKAEQETKNIDLTAYEEEQEENAIISIEELLKKSKEIYAANEVTQYADEGNEPISIADLEARMKKSVEKPIADLEANLKKPVEEPVIIKNLVPRRSNRTMESFQEKLVLDDLNTISKNEKKKEIPVYQTTKRFKSSPVISPIYGIEKKERTTDIELENTANYDKLDEEIRKTNEFLMTLKELQKYLD